jgi:TRAP-type C4-dicarboxylate transport system permease small subunit
LSAMNLLTSAVCALLAWYCFQFVADAYEYEDLLLSDMPAWVFQSILPLAFFLLAYRYLVWTLRRIVAFVNYRGGQA